jgi:hypothetical protein
MLPGWASACAKGREIEKERERGEEVRGVM